MKIDRTKWEGSEGTKNDGKELRGREYLRTTNVIPDTQTEATITLPTNNIGNIVKNPLHLLRLSQQMRKQH
jgi:hypothetical protein